MANVHIDIIDGNRGRQTRRGWVERERFAIVSRLTGAGDAKLQAAITELQANDDYCANYGDEHPAAPRCLLEALDPEHLTSEDVRVRMFYKRPEFEDEDGETVIEVGSTLIQETVNTDVNGDLMTVEYNGQSQSGSVSIPVPQSTVRYQLRLDSPPGDLSRAYVGKLNSGGWWADTAAEPRTWLCTSIVGVSDDDGETYLTTFEFAYLEDTYDEEVVYIDPETGRMPDDIEIGTGTAVFQVIDAVSFNDIPH
jgi:hypothetical protein